MLIFIGYSCIQALEIVSLQKRTIVFTNSDNPSTDNEITNHDKICTKVVLMILVALLSTMDSILT